MPAQIHRVDVPVQGEGIEQGQAVLPASRTPVEEDGGRAVVWSFNVVKRDWPGPETTVAGVSGRLRSARCRSSPTMPS
jgi:hypothetical protein